jgi:hypothetical protein
LREEAVAWQTQEVAAARAPQLIYLCQADNVNLRGLGQATEAGQVRGHGPCARADAGGTQTIDHLGNSWDEG